MNYVGDEGGVLVAFLYSRLRVNTQGWPVDTLPTDPAGTFPMIAFGIDPAISYPEQGGDTLYSDFIVTIFCIGQRGVDDLEPLRPMGREVGAAILTNSGQPGTTFGQGRILSAIQVGGATYPEGDDKASKRWYHGTRWRIRVQPDGAA